MATWPANLEHRVAEVLGCRPEALQPLAGGCVGEVYAFQCGIRRWVLKVDTQAGKGEEVGGLAVEGRMLAYLHEHSQLPVPQVVSFGDDYVLMEYVATNGGVDGNVERHAGALLRQLHEVTGPHFGFLWDTVIGGLHQPNPLHNCWVDFYRDQRLLAMGRQALEAGRLSTATFNRLESLAGRLDQWLVSPVKPALLHGDVWSGNVLARNGKVAAFIDPAIYWGHPEVELAFIDMFHTFGEGFYQAYTEGAGMDAEYFQVRRPLYQLYPLLVHVRLFGGGYVSQVESVLRRFLP